MRLGEMTVVRKARAEEGGFRAGMERLDLGELGCHSAYLIRPRRLGSSEVPSRASDKIIRA